MTVSRESTPPGLPAGVRMLDLRPNIDERGVFTEMFRDEWPSGFAPVQWNLVNSHAGVLRGVHVHHAHDDYLLVAAGRMTVGLSDLRTESPHFGRGWVLDLSVHEPRAVVIPVGVAHGFQFTEPSTHVYAVSEYWNPNDELGCMWNDPGLAIDWPREPLTISDRDRALPSLAQLLEQLEPHQSRMWNQTFSR